MKLLVCDVEATIFDARYQIDGMDYKSTMWQPLARILGEEGIRQEKELHDRWERGEFPKYIDWVEATYKMHKELGLKKEQFDNLIACAEYNPGVVEFFAKLDRKRYVPVLISGGFHELVRRAQQELNIPHGHGACEYTFDKNDGLLSSHSLVPCDFEGKYEYIEILFKQYGLDKNTDWIFIGDGKNDRDIAMRAPISFAFNGHKELKEVTTYHIDDSDNCVASFAKISEILSKLTEEDYHKGYKRKIERFQDIATEKKAESKKKAPKQSEKNIIVKKEDYYNLPKLHLSEIIDKYKVAFVGLQKHYSTYKKLAEKFEGMKNFKFLVADFEHKKRKDGETLKQQDFIFICIDCLSHPQCWRIEKLGVPFAKIRRQPGSVNDPELLERAMSNVLYRYFYEGLREG